jgi:GNAT superfamily N-acetyltransferase
VQIAVRPLEPADAATAAGVIGAAFAAPERAVDPPPSALGVDPDAVAALLARADGGGALALADGTAAGCVLWEERDGGLYAMRLAVPPAWRRRGIARLLMAAAEMEGRRRALPRLHVGTRLALYGNRVLFAAIGFVETGRHSHPGYDRPTWVALEKRL